MQFDLHVHSNISFDSKIKIGILLKKLKEIGLDGVAITDHDSVEGIQKAKEIAQKYDVKVFSAVEISSKKGHILAYGIDEKPPYKKSIADTIDWVHDHGGLACCAHPFRLHFTSIGEEIYHNNFDALEISARSKISQNKATELAARLMNISLIGGSDAHNIERVGLVSTFFYDEIVDEDDLIYAIKHGNCEVRYKIPTSYKGELIPAIPEEELDLLDKFIEDGKKPILPIVETSHKKVQFFDTKVSK